MGISAALLTPRPHLDRRRIAALSFAAVAFIFPTASASSMAGGRSLQEGDLDRRCTLRCLNGGNCTSSSDVDLAENAPREYCICLPGFAGVTCEEETDACGVMNVDNSEGRTEKKRFCKHGAPCRTTVADDGVRHHACLCERASGTNAFAGDQCEYTASVYCDGGNVQRTTFCTNGGTCLDRNEINAATPHAGCACPLDFEGQYCEYPKSTVSASDLDEPAAASSGFANQLLGGLILVLVVAVVLCILYTACKHHRLRRTERRMLSAALDTTSDLQLDPRGSFNFGDGGDEDAVIEDMDQGGGRRAKKETEMTRKGGKLYAGNVAVLDDDENELI